MNRREFLKSILIMAGAAWLGFIRRALRMVRLTVTDPQGRVARTTRPIHIFLGAGEQFDPNPAWGRGADPSLYFVNPRLEQPLIRFFEERWA